MSHQSMTNQPSPVWLWQCCCTRLLLLVLAVGCLAATRGRAYRS